MIFKCQSWNELDVSQQLMRLNFLIKVTHVLRVFTLCVRNILG